MKRALATTAVALAAIGLTACRSGGSAKTAASVDPANFVRTVDNPWFPLRPGSVLRYEGEEDGVPESDVVEVTNRTKDILGVHATVVRDRVLKRGRVVESTYDWYAQDRAGNVWYFGEDTAELGRSGKVTSRAGSWQAGVHGAKPGIFMPANPRVGQSFRQEYLKGQAEDHFRVARLDTSVKVPFVSSAHALRTTEWSPLEPKVLDAKYYVRGIGTVREQSLRGGDERLELVSFKRG